MRNDSLLLSCDVGEKFESVTLHCFAKHDDIPASYFDDSINGLIVAYDLYTSSDGTVWSRFCINKLFDPGSIPSEELINSAVYLPFTYECNGGYWISALSSGLVGVFGTTTEGEVKLLSCDSIAVSSDYTSGALGISNIEVDSCSVLKMNSWAEGTFNPWRICSSFWWYSGIGWLNIGNISANLHVNGIGYLNLVKTIALPASYSCFARGTLVLLADGSTKPIEEVKLTDIVKVWDFDNGCYADAQLLWIGKPKIADRYQRIVTNTGRVFNQINNHRMFSLSKNKFERCQQILGQKVWTVDGEETIVEATWVEEEVEYYNAISFYHMNLITDGFLTSCGYNNLYPIENMKYIKEDRPERPIELYGDIPERWYEGLRLKEHYCDPSTVEPYVKFRLSYAAG